MNRSYFIDRETLTKTFGNPAMVAAFEDLQNTVARTESVATANVEATGKLSDAAFVTLSPNAELPNERVLALGEGLRFVLAPGGVTIVSDAPLVEGGYRVRMTVAGDSDLALPLTGILATRDNVETLTHKTLASPALAGIANYADDAAAASGGVPVGGVYRTGSALKMRVS